MLQAPFSAAASLPPRTGCFRRAVGTGHAAWARPVLTGAFTPTKRVTFPLRSTCIVLCSVTPAEAREMLYSYSPSFGDIGSLRARGAIAVSSNYQ